MQRRVTINLETSRERLEITRNQVTDTMAALEATMQRIRETREAIEQSDRLISKVREVSISS